MNLLNVNGLFSNGFNSLVKEYIQDPIKADLKINNYVIATIGQPPVTPAAYYQRCGSAFWWPQTCENKQRVQIEVTAARNAYNAQYKATRAALLANLAGALKSDPAKDELKAKFVQAENIVQATVNANTKKISSLAKFDSFAWSIAKVVPGAGTFVGYGQKIFGELSSSLNVDVNSLHRWSEEPPGLSEKSLSSIGLQWDNARTIITYVEVGTELETLYKTVYPTAAQSVSNNAGSIGIAAAIAAFLYWKL